MQLMTSLSGSAEIDHFLIGVALEVSSEEGAPYTQFEVDGSTVTEALLSGCKNADGTWNDRLVATAHLAFREYMKTSKSVLEIEFDHPKRDSCAGILLDEVLLVLAGTVLGYLVRHGYQWSGDGVYKPQDAQAAV